ncbi:recombinase zinc ribbon domain-containing protein, partial [Sabulicella rubraurantiaca]|uniref:zinc ribbon domain-containing protein n=1 Tax=Sabulicella rubraurantiaca TaxID=2811429 RepID=UPI001A95AC52
MGGAIETARDETFRIVEDELWQRVQARHADLDARAAVSRNPLRARQPAKYPFSGLLVCAQCGRGYQVSGKGRFGCAGKAAGICSNGKTVAQSVLEGRVLAGLKERLLSPEAIAAAVEEARLGLVAHRREAMTKESRLRRRLGEVTWAWVAASTRSPRACRPGNCETACR